jgi:hypothetical protein
MTFRKSILLLLSLSMIAALVACSSSNSSTTTPPVITVTLSSPTTFPTILYVNDTLSVTATVANDTANGGVIWSCAPGNSAATCGSFSSGASAVPSGTPVTYTAPTTAVAAVTVTATSVTTSTISATSASIAINATVISVAFSSGMAPPASLAASAPATIAATVTGDPAGLGVNWSCTPATSCGASNFSSASTASGTSTTFTAPSTAGNVTITATSISDDTQSASATVAITSAASTALIPGNYTFWLAGTDANGSSYYVAGAFNVSNAGAITGEQDFVDYYYVLTQDTLSGSYAVTPDGNLQITLNTGDPCIGPGANSTCTQTGSTSAGTGVEVLNATLTSSVSAASSSARITEFDTWATASGQMEPQSVPAATPLGGYAFSVSGLDANSPPNALGIGGVVDVDTSGNISGTGSVFDENDGGTILQAQTFTGSMVTAIPDGNGRVTFTLNPSSASGVSQIVLIGYFVNSTHVRLVESFDNLGGTTGGQAFAQTGTGGFSTTSFEGSSYVFGAVGSDNSTDGVLQVAGVLTGNSDGSTVSGNLSFNDLTNMSPQGGTTIAAGTYAVDSTGRVTLTNLTDSTTSPTFTYTLQLYLDGNGNARVLSVDNNDEVDGVAGLQNSSLTAGTFLGTYAMGAFGVDPNFLDEFDAVGPVAADGIGTFPGFVDLNWIFNPTPPGPTLTDQPVTPATFAATSTAGIFTGNITGIDVTNCQAYTPTGAGCTADAFTYYFVSPNSVVGIENDANQLTLIRFELQP